MTYSVNLGGKTWELPDFVFGVIRRHQASVLNATRKINGAPAADIPYLLDAETLETCVKVTAAVLREVDENVTIETLDALPFKTIDLVMAQRPILQSLGVVPADEAPAGESEADPKAPASTTSSPA